MRLKFSLVFHSVCVVAALREALGCLPLEAHLMSSIGEAPNHV